MGEPFRYQHSETERCTRSSLCCLVTDHPGPCVCDACTFPMLEHTDEDLAECIEIAEQVERDMAEADGAMTTSTTRPTSRRTSTTPPGTPLPARRRRWRR